MTEMNRLARLRPGNLGHLGFLPIEVCNKIYAYLLAEFHPGKIRDRAPGTAIDAWLGDLRFISHSIDAAILRASRDVHREAYDLMVKENRFVHLKFQGVPHFLLAGGDLNIVTVNTEHVRQFKGYVLEVNTSYSGDGFPQECGSNGAFEAMALAANLDVFGQRLMAGNVVPGFSSRLAMRLNLGPMVAAGREARNYKDLESLKCYFTEKTEKSLLQPLRENLYRVQDVQICGLVSADVISSALKDMASSRWGGPQDVLDHLAARKEVGMQSFRNKEYHTAGGSWAEDALGIEILRSGDDWSGLIREGGEQFIHQVAELYFQLNLNCAHINLSALYNGNFGKMAETFLLHASTAMVPGRWKPGFTWRPSEELEAKFHFRSARLFRLRGNLSDVQQAVREIDQAFQLRPEDPAILRERQLVSMWVLEAAMTAQ